MDPDPTDLAVELHAKATDLLDAGEPQAASELAQRAADLFASVDVDHPDHANALILRARIAHALGDFTASLAHADRATRVMAAARDAFPDEPIVFELQAHAVCALATALHALGRYDEAELHLLAALADTEAALGPDVAEVGDLCNLLGIGHKYQARYDEAAARYARAIAIARAHHGDASTAMASLEHNLGGLAHARGDVAAGEPHARRSVELREAILGPDHPTVAADLAAWASLLDELGRTDEAESALRRALAIFERAYGEQHFEVGFTLGTLGALHASAERYALSLPLLTRAHAIMSAAVGPEHVETARIDEYLAVVHHALGNAPVALAHAQRAAAICVRTFPADHPRTIDSKSTLEALTK